MTCAEHRELALVESDLRDARKRQEFAEAEVESADRQAGELEIRRRALENEIQKREGDDDAGSGHRLA